MNKTRGFTLVELLVVIAIISILTVITVSQFETARKRSRDAQRKGDLNSVGKALQMYFADYGALPAAGGVNALFNSGVGLTDATGYVYMKVMPKETKASWPNYCYKVDSLTSPKKYAVYANLENTSDADCRLDGDGKPLYTCEGGKYCFAITSPNAVLDNSGNLN
jgi:general secretion pathway protein G